MFLVIRRKRKKHTASSPMVSIRIASFVCNNGAILHAESMYQFPGLYFPQYVRLTK